MHPMGWDAFGLPAENAALDRKVDPADWTYSNIAHMKQQMRSLGLDIDWKREVATCSPEYYKWTQWLFLKLFQAGLAYQKKASVNWDPVDKTVLANEQVDSNGKSWRSGAVVEKISVKQWYFKITNYTQELLDDLEGLDWPANVKQMQRNWIAPDHGLRIHFQLTTADHKKLPELRIFTTRPETFNGVTFLAVGPDHHLLSEKSDLPQLLSSPFQQ